MKKFVSILASIIFFAALTGKTSAVRNPIGSATTPPSSRRSGLIRSPNPIDTSGNLVITGNLGRGRHFRGVVPYRATSDFSTTLGSSSLDAFLRDSAGSEDFGRHIGKTRSYYSQSRTVTTTMPGRSGILRPPSTKIDGRATYGLTPAQLPKRHLLTRQDIPPLGKTDSSSYYRLTAPFSQRPMSTTTQQMAKTLSSQMEKLSRDKQSVPTESINKQRQEQVEQFRRDLKSASDKAVELEQTLTPRDKSLQPFTKLQPIKETPQQLELQTPKQIGKIEPIDVYEQMKLQIDNLKKSSESQRLKTEKPAEETAEDKEKSTEEISPANQLLEIGLTAAKAKSILGEHKTFASFVNDKFNQHLKAAEDYLKQGKYYRAADVYTLASIYKPDDPLPYAGKSHALFAAGEYMSSALFLSRALDIFPEYAQFKIDIEAMVGDRDMLESRIADVEQWVEKSGAPELQFLLGYIYYQMGRLDVAKKAIDAAYEKMPQSPAVITIKKAVDENHKPR